MAKVVKKQSISFELAQEMVNAAVAKARGLGVAENVAILDDGGNLKAFGRMDGVSIPTIEIAQNKAYAALFGVSTQDFFNRIQPPGFGFHQFLVLTTTSNSRTADIGQMSLPAMLPSLIRSTVAKRYVQESRAGACSQNRRKSRRDCVLQTTHGGDEKVRISNVVRPV